MQAHCAGLWLTAAVVTGGKYIRKKEEGTRDNHELQRSSTSDGLGES